MKHHIRRLRRAADIIALAALPQLIAGHAAAFYLVHIHIGKLGLAALGIVAAPWAALLLQLAASGACLAIADILQRRRRQAHAGAA